MAKDKLHEMIEEAEKVASTVEQKYRDDVFRAHLTKLMLSELESKGQIKVVSPVNATIKTGFKLSREQIPELERRLVSLGDVTAKVAGLTIAKFLYDQGIETFSLQDFSECYITAKKCGIQSIPAVEKLDQLVRDIKAERWFDSTGWGVYQVSALGHHKINELMGAAKNGTK